MAVLSPRASLTAPVSLETVAASVQTALLGIEQILVVPDPLASVLPGGGVRRGSVVLVDGPVGAGSTSIALQLAAAATDTGEWAALLDDDGSLSSVAVADLGVALERFLVVRDVTAARWPNVVALLSDAVSLVACRAPRGLPLGIARRLAARARRRGTVLVVSGEWPGEAGLRVWTDRSVWSGLDADGGGALSERSIHLMIEGQGVKDASRSIALSSRLAS